MCQHGLLNGYGRIIYNDGAYYVGMFVDDKYEGYGELTDKKGSKFNGTFKDGKKDGIG